MRRVWVALAMALLVGVRAAVAEDASIEAGAPDAALAPCTDQVDDVPVFVDPPFSLDGTLFDDASIPAYEPATAPQAQG